MIHLHVPDISSLDLNLELNIPLLILSSPPYNLLFWWWCKVMQEAVMEEMLKDDMHHLSHIFQTEALEVWTFDMDSIS